MTAIQFTLPEWTGELIATDQRFPDDDARMELVIELSRRNIALGTGGPFGAAVFDAEGRVIALGVNRVVPERCSVAHAEMMAYMAAQTALGRPRLNEDGKHYTLATSAQPCCQCYGATIWAGIDTLLIGARSEDVMRLTEFDEGPLPADWIGELNARGIEVRRDLRREEACEVLAAYSTAGGTHY